MNAGYDSVGLPEPRTYQVGENSPPIDRQRWFRFDLGVQLEDLKKPLHAVTLRVCAMDDFAYFPMTAFPDPILELGYMRHG
jgi:hypothetical protein